LRPGVRLGQVSNVLNEEKKQQVLALGRLGWSLRRIEGATGVRRETAGSYLRAAGIPLRPSGGWGRSEPKPANEMSTGSAAEVGRESAEETAQRAKPANEPSTGPVAAANDELTAISEQPAKPAIEASTGPVTAREPQAASCHSARSACDPYREFIEASLAKGRNAMAIWQDLVDDCGFAHRYASVKRYVRGLRASPQSDAHPIIATPPGEEGQVDYGSGPMVRDPGSGRYRRTRQFVFTLAWSRKSVRLLTFSSSVRIWAELHEKAFARLGGAPRTVILDNLREGVLAPDIYDPALNPLYRDALAHYAVTPLPCRVRDPNRKGKVESAVAHSQKTPLKGLRFETMEEAQAYLDRWEERWADKRIHGTTKRQVAAMFAEERPALLPLPLEPFRYYQYGERTVHLDGCVEVEAAYYSAPPGWMGRRVRVQWNGLHVRLLDPHSGQLLREHLRQPRGAHRIHDEDRSRKTPLTTVQLLARTAKAGAHIGQFCQTMYNRRGELAIRRILGVLSLAKKYGAAAVDGACSTAMEMGVYEYPFLRKYLERTPAAPLNLRQIDPLIRQLTLYRDLIDSRTQEDQP
jgi:transposase